MHDNSTKITKQEVLSLLINTIKAEDRPKFISKLLTGLNDKEISQDNGIITKGDIENASDLIQRIIENIDWEVINDSEYGEDKFFNGVDGLYTSLKEKIANIKNTNDDFKPKTYSDLTDYWNESIAELMTVLATAIDPEGARAYENSGLLIELTEPDGKIDTEHLRAGLSAEGATAALRIIDIINADAGNSFVKEEDMYIYKTLIEEGVFECDWVADGEKKTLSISVENVCFNAAADKFLNTFITGVTDCKRLELENLFDNSDYCYRGTISFDGLPQIFNIVLKITKQVRFKVVSDPWVVPWYNVDGETYRYVRDGDKKVSVLSNDKRLDFTREKGEDKYIRLLMPQYKRKVEVEDLNRNFWVIAQVLTGICIDLFDPNGPIQKMLKGLLIEIAQIWENTTYLWAAFDLLNQRRYYNQTHCEVYYLSYNELFSHLKYDNFDNTRKIPETFSHLENMYPDYNLAIMPILREDNYEHNFYSGIIIPGIWIYNRNSDSPAWEQILFSVGDGGSIIIKLEDFKEKIYGLLENEETYSYIAPITAAEDLMPEEDERYYGLLRDFITFSAEVEDTIKSINFEINLIDLAKQLVKNENVTIYKCIGEYQDNSNIIDLTITQSPDITTEDSGQIDISKGFYQGELLSTYVNSHRVIYDIYPLPTAYLKPESDDADTVKANYKNNTALKTSDGEVLREIIDNFLAFNDSSDDSQHSAFWRDRDSYFTTGSHFYGIENGVSKSGIRSEIKKARWDTSQNYYTDIDAWRDENKDYFKAPSGKEINKYTLLMVEGARECSYTESKDYMDEGNTRTYFPPSNGGTVDGLIAPLWAKTAAGAQQAQTGAVISIPNRRGDRFTSFYDNHTSFTESSTQPYIHHPAVKTQEQISGITYKLVNQDRFVTTQEAMNCNINEIETYGTVGGLGEEQWLVMLRDGQTEVTQDNWLVVKQDCTYLGGMHLINDNDQRTYNECYAVSIGNYGKKTYHEMVTRNIAQQIITNESIDVSSTTLATLMSKVTNAINSRSDAACAEIKISSYFSDNDWLIQQCILHGKYDDLFLEQCKMFKNNISGWNNTTVSQLLERYNVTPEVYGGGYTFEGFTVNSNYFIDGTVRRDVDVFVFGPNGIYSRRRYSRGTDNKFSLKWDEETSGGNVDDLRNGYTVISNNKPNVNYEKYKSKGKLRIIDDPDVDTYGKYNPTDDDTYFNQYHINWDDNLKKWDIRS